MNHNNELIAKFMGLEQIEHYNIYGDVSEIVWFREESPGIMYLFNHSSSHASQLWFDSEWNWLMPVCQKIKEIKKCSSLGFWNEVNGDSMNIENTYKYCIEFIKRYNISEGNENGDGE